MLSRLRQRGLAGLGIISTALVLCSCSTSRVVNQPTREIYLIIDDAGPNFRQTEAFLEISEPLTIAVLPDYTYTEKTALVAQNCHPDKELILHQPMEAINSKIDPGPGAILLNTPVSDVGRILRDNLAQIPSAMGMNNHMGSRVTQNRELLEATMEFCQTNNLFFIDSFTTPDSIAGLIANEYGVPTVQQQIFLDNDRDVKAIQKQFSKGMRIAAKQGSVVMIGHVWSPETARVIEQMIPFAKSHSFSFHTISEIFESVH
jgi:uncharacterized protein